MGYARLIGLANKLEKFYRAHQVEREQVRGARN